MALFEQVLPPFVKGPVLGVLAPRPRRTRGYPWTPLFFTAFSLWTVIVVIRNRPMEAVGGAVTLGIAALLTWVVGEGDRDASS